LRHVHEESKRENLTLALRQLCNQRAQGLVILHTFQCGVFLAKGVGQGIRVGVGGEGFVQGDRVVGVAGFEAFIDLFGTQVEALGDLAGGRRPAQVLGQLAARRADRQVELFEAPRHAH
jgi:hypothetical protein